MSDFESRIRATVEAYSACKTISGTAYKLGCSRATVRKRLAKAGVTHTYNGRVAGHGAGKLVGADRTDLEIKVAKQAQKIRNLHRELKKAQKDRLTAAEVRHYILGLREQAEAVPQWVGTPSGQSKHDNVPMTMWSDFHWGETVKSSQVFGLNEYDMSIAAERLQTLVGNTTWLLREHLSRREYPGLVLALGGDMVSGDIHQELSETNEQHMMPVMVDLYGHLRRAIDQMADEFGALYVPCVFGNHGRTNKKPQHKDQAYKNFDWLLYNLLADWYQDDARVQFLIGDDDEISFAVAGHRYRMTHGAQFRGGVGFIGALAPIVRGEHRKRIASQSQDTVYDTLLLAHFHQCIWRPRLVVNGSLKGYDEFATDNSFEFEPPKQMVWLTDPTLGKVSPLEAWAALPRDESPCQFAQVQF